MKKPRANKIVPRAETATPSTAKPPEGWQDPEIEAANLFQQLEQERARIRFHLAKLLRDIPRGPRSLQRSRQFGWRLFGRSWRHL